MKKIKINDNLTAIYKYAKNTPRCGFVMYFKSCEQEKYAGINSLLSRLLLEGTKKYNSEELAELLDANGIEISIDIKQDFIRIKSVFLNSDADKALEFFEDIIKNSTFDEFEKDVFKLKGEIISELDSPKSQAADTFIRNLFKGHFYSNTFTKILEDIDKIKKEDVINAWKNLLDNSKKSLTFIGDLPEKKVKDILAKHFYDIKNTPAPCEIPSVKPLKGRKIVTVQKDDASQAQIYQGWLIPNISSTDYPAIIVMNSILGAAGLSSRLFLELRDKQGLAYTVRSSAESLEKSGTFTIYIGTDPKNIQKSIDGFQIEIDKLKNELVSEEELKGAKENVLGRFLYFTQTNLQKASMTGYDVVMGFGYDWCDKYLEAIKNVSAKEVRDAANKYLTDNTLICILAPEKYLEKFK